MSVVAFFIERRLLRAIQKGEVVAAPRTGAESEEYADEPSTAAPSGEITTRPPN
jgi:hypothetical protein